MRATLAAFRSIDLRCQSRTNQFQEVVAITHRHVATIFETVEESEELIDLVDGRKREVDAVVRGSTAGYEVVVSVEANAYKRGATRPWVEQQIKKHESLPTNVLILVSKNGFSKSALELAARSGVVTISEEAAETPNREYRIVTRLNSIWAKAASLSPTAVGLMVERDGTLFALPALSGAEELAVSLEDGTKVGTLQDVVRELLQHNLQRILEGLGIRDVAEDTDAGFEVAFEDPGRSEAAAGLFIADQERDGELLRIPSLGVRGTVAFRVSEVPLTHVRLGKLDASYGEAAIAGRDALLVVTESADRGMMTMRVRPSKSTSS